MADTTGGGGGGSKPILTIPIDSSAWDRFSDSFNKYQTELGAQSSKWESTNQGVKKTAAAFDQVQSAFDALVAASTNPKFADRSSGVFSRFEKSSKQVKSYWHATARDLEKSGKSLDTMGRGLAKWSGLLKGGGIAGAGLGLVGGAVGAVDKASNDLAQQNKFNRMLGLKPGQGAAFENAFGPAGGDSDLLSKIAAAKQDTSKWAGLFAAGFTKDEIQTEDPEKIAAQMLQRAGEKFNAAGINGGQWAQSTHVTDFLNTNQLRLAGSYNDQQYAGMQDRYDTTLPKFAVKQSVADKATQYSQDFDAAWKELDTAFNKAAMSAGADLPHLTSELADWVSAFADSKEFHDDVKGFTDDVHELYEGAKWISDKLNDLFGLNKPDAGKQGPGVNVAEGSFAAKALEFAKHPWDVLTGKDQTAPGGHYRFPGDDIGTGVQDGGGTGAGAGGSGLTSDAPGFKDRLLDAIKMNESSGKNGQTNPHTGAAGLYQITPANYRAAGVDPMDPIASRALASKIYEEKLKKYHGDTAKALASYDGFGGLDKDVAKYGDQWRDHIGEYQKSGETINYLKRIEKQGFDLRAQQQQQEPTPEPTKYDKRDSGSQGQWQAPTPDNIDGFKVEQYDATQANAKAQSDASDAAAPAEKSLKQHLEDFAGYFKTPRDEHQQQQQAPKAAPYQQAPVVINVQTNQLPGTVTSVTAGQLGSY